jgi:hypothetical protein
MKPKELWQIKEFLEWLILLPELVFEPYQENQKKEGKT